MNILIKFSGEFFDAKDTLSKSGQDFLKKLKEKNITSGYCVVGGGNRMRGKNSEFERNASDKIGVLSTIMNGFILQEQMRIIGMNSKVFSHFNDFGQKYDAKQAMHEYKQNKWVILTSGLGNVGYISTDLSSVIKALELKVDMLVKVTKIDGVYDKDPSEPNAKRLENISYERLLSEKLEVMDLSAISIAYENKLKIGITSIDKFLEFLENPSVGSIVN